MQLGYTGELREKIPTCKPSLQWVMIRTSFFPTWTWHNEGCCWYTWHYWLRLRFQQWSSSCSMSLTVMMHRMFRNLNCVLLFLAAWLCQTTTSTVTTSTVTTASSVTATSTTQVGFAAACFQIGMWNLSLCNTRCTDRNDRFRTCETSLLVPFVLFWDR